MARLDQGSRLAGTPSSLLPLEMGECNFSKGDDAKMLRTLTNPDVVTHHALPNDWSVRSLLEDIAALDPPANALIDAGALVTGMSNREVAEYLLPVFPHFDGVVYLEQGGHKKILLRGGKDFDLDRCGVPKEKRFTFFDQVRLHPPPPTPHGVDLGWRPIIAGAHDRNGHSAAGCGPCRADPRRWPHLPRLRSSGL